VTKAREKRRPEARRPWLWSKAGALGASFVVICITLLSSGRSRWTATARQTGSDVTVGVLVLNSAPSRTRQ
jgi:hypothetical protein